MFREDAIDGPDAEYDLEQLSLRPVLMCFGRTPSSISMLTTTSSTQAVSFISTYLYREDESLHLYTITVLVWYITAKLMGASKALLSII